MKIRYFAESFKTKRASHRLRGDLMARTLKAQGYDVTASGSLEGIDNDTVVIFLKLSQPEQIEYAKNLGALTIYDLCDNKFGEKPEYAPCCKLADIVTVNSEAMGESVLAHTGRRSLVVPDPYERPELSPVFAPSGPIKLLWFGGGSSLKFFPMVPVWQKLEQEIGDYEFTMVTGKAERVYNKQLGRYNKGVHKGINFAKLKFFEWNWELQGQLLAATDIVLMPVDTDHYRTETKSANRLIDGVMSGKFVITSPLDSYREFDPYTWQTDFITGIQWARNNPSEVLERIKLGQDYTRKNYSPEVIAQRWLEVFNGKS